MKIAEALVRIKDIKGKLSELQRKIDADQLFERVQNDQMIPSIEGLLEDFLDVSEVLSVLKTRITKTNATHGLINKIHEMEKLRSIVSKLELLSRNKQEFVSLRHITYDQPAIPMSTFATYNVEDLIESLEAYRARIRELDLELQRLNWEVDLVK